MARIFLSTRILYSLITFMIFLSCKQEMRITGEEQQVLTSMQDTAFWQEYHDAFPVNNDPSGVEVRSIAVDSHGDVWIATPVGVFTKNHGDRSWKHAIPESDQGPSFAVEVDANSTVWMSTWNNVYRIKDNKLERMTGVVSPIATFCVATEGVYALGPNGVWLYSGEGFEKKNYTIARSIRDAVSDKNNGLWIASDVGLYHSTPQSTKQLVNEDELISAYIRGVALNGEHVWAGGLGGVTMLENEKKKEVLLPEHGIPSLNVNCVKRSDEGVMWVGTDVGVVRYYKDSTHSLLFSRRWLLDDKVNDIAFDSNVESCHAYGSVDKFLSEVKRVLKPGGHLLLVDFRNEKNVENMNTLKTQLRDTGMELLTEENITPNVIQSIEAEDESKKERIRTLIPQKWQKLFSEFAGVVGSRFYETLKDGTRLYYRFELRKNS